MITLTTGDAAYETRTAYREDGSLATTCIQTEEDATLHEEGTRLRARCGCFCSSNSFSSSFRLEQILRASIIFDEPTQTVLFPDESVLEEATSRRYEPSFPVRYSEDFHTFPVRHTKITPVIFTLDRAQMRALIRLRALMLAHRAEKTEGSDPTTILLASQAPLWLFMRVAELLDDRDICPHMTCKSYILFESDNPQFSDYFWCRHRAPSS